MHKASTLINLLTVGGLAAMRTAIAVRYFPVTQTHSKADSVSRGTKSGRSLRQAACVLGAIVLFLSVAVAKPPDRIINHLTVPFCQPVEIFSPADGCTSAISRIVQPMQPLAPGGSGEIRSRAPFVYAQPAGAPGGEPAVADQPALLSATSEGLGIRFRDCDLGSFRWGILLQPAPSNVSATEVFVPDVASTFSPLELRFHPAGNNLPESMAGEATTAGLSIRVTASAFPGGFVDFHTELTNESRSTKERVYCAVVTEWSHPETVRRTISYDSRLWDLAETTTTPFRRGDGHHLALQRGTDWINTTFLNGIACVALNDFSESFSYFIDSGSNPRWTTANQPFLGEEAQSVAGKLYLATEISRGMTSRFRDRYLGYVLPEQRKPVTMRRRVMLSRGEIPGSKADEAFIGYTCYKKLSCTKDDSYRLEIGVPHVVFGTSYFPYSTLGENFDFQKLSGMDREGYWPLAADTVNQWQLFAGDIRRDLRIAKAMGFDRIRLHHLELLTPIKQTKLFEYLDFLFGEMRVLGLQALVDIQMSPEDTAAIAKRYRNTICGIEVENEVLIWGMKEGREKYWRAVYDAVKAVAPEMPVHLTSHANAGIFTKLEEIGAKSDKVSFHSYVDSPDAIVSGRDIALAVGNYAGKRGKPSAITEWNWRFLTRMPFEERAKLYPDIIGNALVTRSIGEFYQFQFHETLAVNPRGLRGIRHYEPLFLSRRPKPEAFELMKLIRKYSAGDHAVNRLEVDYTTVELTGDEPVEAKFTVRNLSDHAIDASIAVEAGEDVEASGETEHNIGPHSQWNYPVRVSTRSNQPGFYYFFLRVQDSDGTFRYGWGEARRSGAPRLDFDTPTTVTYPRGVWDELRFDWNRPVTVVYGVNPPGGVDVESAILIANTLESATGRPVALYQEDLLPPKNADGNLILVGTLMANTMIAQAMPGIAGQSGKSMVRRVDRVGGAQSLIITGDEPVDVEYAAVDFVLRYWRNAKDSATRKLGGRLIQTELRKGSDPTKLP